jgi:homoserine O-acetyltransferase/O-succinyltransferase
MPFPNQTTGTFFLRDVRFRSGDVLAELRLHYLTLGTPRRDASGRISNAILMLHGTTSTYQNFLRPTVANELFGPGQALDAERFFIVIPDDIGHGGSSKPSDGLGPRFPRFGYHDCVTLQRRLVTEHLGVEHLQMVFGYSMGGMQAWLWGERYPDCMDAILPLACQPSQIAGRNLFFRRLITTAIRNDAGWQGGAYQQSPKAWAHAAALLPMMSDSPVAMQAQAPTRAAAEQLFDEVVANAASGYDANDLLSWLEASADYDPEPDLHTIKAAVLAVNFADDMINPPSLGIMEQLIRRVPRGRYVLIPESAATKGHQTVFLAAVWKSYVEQLLREVASRA